MIPPATVGLPNLNLETLPYATRRNCYHVTVNRHLHALDKVNKHGDGVPHELSTNNLTKRVPICRSLRSR